MQAWTLGELERFPSIIEERAMQQKPEGNFLKLGLYLLTRSSSYSLQGQIVGHIAIWYSVE